ncbi:MAG TPA: ABC transporter permease, partial [Enterovirga sp.]
MAGSTLASLSGDPAVVAAEPVLAEPVLAEPAGARRVGRWETWRRFRRHPLALVSSVLLALMVLGVLLGPILWPVAIDDIDFAATLEGPSWQHPFGTDDLGQDLLARMIYGGRISLAVGFAAMFVATLVGVFVGSVAGMSRRLLDPVLMWLTDLFLSLPQLP